MKKLSKLFVASLLLAPLAACSGDDAGDSGNVTANGTADTGTGTNNGTGDTGNMDDTDPTGNGEDPTGDPTGNMDDSSGGGSGAMFCQEQCEADADCMVMGTDTGMTCSTNSNTCFSECSATIECQVPVYEGVNAECTANADCEAGSACIEYGDTDYCVVLEETTPCVAPSVAVTVSDVDEADATVCGQDSQCEENDLGDMTCSFNGEGPDSTCESLMCPDSLTCDDAAPRCTCATAQDCIDAEWGDACTDGVCGCAGNDSCADRTPVFDGGTFVCTSI